MSPLADPTFFFGVLALLAILISGFVLASMRLLRGRRTTAAVVVFVVSGVGLAWLGVSWWNTVSGPLPALIGVALAVFVGFVLARPRTDEPPRAGAE